ncbi:GNAT family N-acetyltransferase [Marinobacter xestospongiae]|uniref:GNAT family N-acetyltransferase n=1 Tax=Marinobacter xestospongiae TaxID=994319 RepID=A0ABU3VZU4_9GAMM|nr:GNAT family N-acetyltransferase [Marinobacter xestospongiae]MDV2079251.1 GNAT family N-acetyltransferase [Marinobacter xestospongiae]
MATPVELQTERLRLRQWCPGDREPFARMGSDPEVMAYFPSLLSREDSDAMADRCQALIQLRGWGFWALETRDGGEFVGFVGLHEPAAELPFSPCVEIGWRLAREAWGRGYATEAASAALDFAFDQLGLAEVVSFTTLENRRSRAVMERLGMRSAADENFEHPAVAVGNPLRPHCLYRLGRDDWRRGSSS